MTSKRESIILADKALVESVLQIKTVKRHIQQYEELNRYALTQFPVVGVVGGLPVPQEHRQGRTGQADIIISQLQVDFYVYFQEADDEKMDTTVSSLVNYLWVALYSDPTRGNLCHYTRLTAEPNYEVWNPFVAFKITAFHEYQHSIEGI
jgi:hypothetical protein